MHEVFKTGDFLLYPSSFMLCQDETFRALTIEDEDDEEEEGTTHSRPAPFTRYVPSHHARERELLSAGFRGGGGHLHACSVLPARFPQA